MFDMQTTQTIDIDILIVGAGPAGIACALKCAQLQVAQQRAVSIMVLEKGNALGAHSISGAVFNPVVLDELLPNWRQLQAPVFSQVTEESFVWLTNKRIVSLPIPPSLSSKGCDLISLSRFMKWFGQQAMDAGVDIFTSFSAQDVIVENDKVCGVIATGPGEISEENPLMQIQAKTIILAEGARGYLSEKVMAKFDLRRHCSPQTYALGVKELWKLPTKSLQPGNIVHTSGYPLSSDVYGGGFVYQLTDQFVTIGQVIGLDYTNPKLDPCGELQRFKCHPFIRKMLTGGECIGYGARALNEGGWQALPQTYFPGGVMIGCAAGTLNVAQMKGIHHAMRSGMLAAENLMQGDKLEVAIDIDKQLRESDTGKQLKAARNVRPGFAKFGRVGGFINAAVDQYVFKGRAPWTLKTKFPDSDAINDHLTLKEIVYPKPDGEYILSKTDLLYLSGVHHREGAASHLKVLDNAVEAKNIKQCKAPETHYCPANVYSLVTTNDGIEHLHIDSQNCLHCKACDIKDAFQNIKWTAAEGGDGPSYRDM